MPFSQSTTNLLLLGLLHGSNGDSGYGGHGVGGDGRFGGGLLGGLGLFGLHLLDLGRLGSNNGGLLE